MTVTIVCDMRSKLAFLACNCLPKSLIFPDLAKGGEKETWLWNTRG